MNGSLGNLAYVSTERAVKTFHARRGRLTKTRSELLAEAVPQYLLPHTTHPLDLRSHFDSPEVIVDFGCGMGDSTISLLEKGKSVLAVDVHTPGICRIAQWANEHRNKNLALIHGDGIPILESQIKSHTISKFLVLFPDPWPKARHNKRRVIQLDFLELVARLLEPNGRLVIATDIDSYAEHITEVIASTNSMRLVSREYELPETKFRTRALEAGRQISVYELAPNT